MNKLAQKVEDVLTSLEQKIMAKLKLDDSGKLHRFFKGEVKRFKDEIDTIETNKQVEEVKQKQALSSIDNDIEDAEEALEEAYTDVNIEEIGSNEAMKNFSNKFWRNIEAKEQRLKELKEYRERVIESYERLLKERNEKIAKRQERIKAIS